ncbi:MAG TPA: hypothetical protein VE967_12945 [Gemmatimonadaceae bacterium]|nr:hypothetical protein [Gemmatimonadaceae bacterium]
MRTRAALSVLSLCFVAPVRAPTHARSEIGADALRAELTAFAHDSMMGRRAGTPDGDRAAAFIARALERTGVVPAGRGGAFAQPLPLTRVRLDATHTTMGYSAMPLFLGTDFLPLTGAFGFITPDSALNVEATSAVYAGNSSQLLDTNAVAGKVVFLAVPRRANHQPDYQLQTEREQIHQYRKAVALVYPMLDLMPRVLVERLMAPRLELTQRYAALMKAPPIIAVVKPTSAQFSYRVYRDSVDARMSLRWCAARTPRSGMSSWS